MEIKRETTLVEKAKNDKNFGRGVGRGNTMKNTREIFKTWLLIPRTFLGHNEQMYRVLGIGDSEMMELCAIKNQAEFASRFGVIEPTLSHWKREMQKGDDFREVKSLMKSLTKNLIGALYRQALLHGDAPRIKLWFQIIEGWNETIGYNVPVNTYALTNDEKDRLDKLISKNCG